MDYPVKHFESDDAGAPSLDRTQPGSLIQVLKGCLIDGYNLQPFDSLEMDGEHGKANFSGNHGFRVHQVISISGASGSGWNGEHRVIATGNQWITFEVEGEPAAESGSGLEIKAAPVGGWEIAHINAEETRAAFRSTNPASTGMFWYLDDRRYDQMESPSTYSSADLDFRYFRGKEGMTDIDTAERTWGVQYIFAGSSSRGDVTPYDIVADDRTVYLLTNPTGRTSGENRIMHTFGDFVSAAQGDPYACWCCLAWLTNSSASSSENGTNFAIVDARAFPAYQSLSRICRDSYGATSHQDAMLLGNSIAESSGDESSVKGAVGGGFNVFVHEPLLVLQYVSDGELVTNPVIRGLAPGLAQPLNYDVFGHRDVANVGGKNYKALSCMAKRSSTAGAQFLIDIHGPWQ